MQNPYRALSNINPQREDGRREINNEVFHALMRAGLTGGEYQVVLTVIDCTWGFAKQSAIISLTHFEESTELTRQGVVKALKSAEAKRIIAVSRNGTKGSEYIFNKHYDTWLINPARQPQFTSSPDQLGNHSSLDGPPASKPQFTSPHAQLGNHSSLDEPPELGNHSSLDWSTAVDQSRQPQLTSTSQLVTPTTEPVKKGGGRGGAPPKENIKETYKENRGRSPPGLGADTPASKYLFEKTGRKRWQNLVQKEQFEKAESEVGEVRMKEAIDWALTSGISNIKSIITAARRGHGEPERRNTGPTGKREVGGRRDKAPTHEEYLASLPRQPPKGTGSQ